MNKYHFEVKLIIEVEAFGQLDAEEAVRDTFGLGDVCGLNVIESEVGGHLV